MKHLLLGCALALTAVALAPATAGAATLHGVVVGHSGHRTLLVATSSGRVVAIKGHAPTGSRIVGHQVVGRASRAMIHGVVVKTKGSTIFVASNRHLVAIRQGRGLASNTPSTPAPGTIVTSNVSVGPSGQLDQTSETEDGQDTSATITIQATISAVGPGTVTLNVNGTDITFDLPNGLTLPDTLVGQTVTFTISLGNGDDQGDQGGDGSGNGGGDG